MNGIMLLVAISSLGVDYSWRTTAEGDVEYVLQVEPAFIQALVDGEEIHSDVPAEVGRAQRVVLRIDTKELPKTAADAQRARTILRGQSRTNGEYPTVLWRAGKPPEETTAVTYGWQPNAEGQLLYYLQVDPVLLKTLNSGDEIHAIIRPEAGRVSTFAVAAGVKQLPRIAGGSTATSPPATAGSTATQPATSPPASTYDNSGRRRFNSSSEPATASDPARASTARTGTSPSSEPPLYSPRTNDSPAARSSATDTSSSRPRPRWSSTDVPTDSNTQPIQPMQPQPETRPGYTYGPQAPEPKPQTQRELYPAPGSTYPTNNNVQPADDPQRRAEMETPRFDTSRDFSTTGNYQPAPDPRFQQPVQNDYRNQAGPGPYESQRGYDYSQPVPDRISSRNPNSPLGIPRPPAQDQFAGSAATTPTAFPQTPPLQASIPPTSATLPATVPPAAAVPPAETKPASQPLSVWTLLWCLVFFSVGGNLYLGWTAAEFYSRYKLATERLRSGTRT